MKIAEYDHNKRLIITTVIILNGFHCICMFLLLKDRRYVPEVRSFPPTFFPILSFIVPFQLAKSLIYLWCWPLLSASVCVCVCVREYVRVCVYVLVCVWVRVHVCVCEHLATFLADKIITSSTTPVVTFDTFGRALQIYHYLYCFYMLFASHWMLKISFYYVFGCT